MNNLILMVGHPIDRKFQMGKPIIWCAGPDQEEIRFAEKYLNLGQPDIVYVWRRTDEIRDGMRLYRYVEPTTETA